MAFRLVFFPFLSGFLTSDAAIYLTRNLFVLLNCFA